jgi:hypothetical protein
MRPGVLPMTPEQSDRVLNGLVGHPLGRRNWNWRNNNFFDSQGVVHKELRPEGKNSRFRIYKGVVDRLLKRIQRVRPASYCSRDFFLLHDNASAHKAASACQFLPQKWNNPLSPPPLYSPDLSTPHYFLFPKLKLKGLHFSDVSEIQQAVTDELKKVQKEDFSAAFQKLYDRVKASVCSSGAYLN